jgi:ABC-2 type transport system ATP-binding protein
MGGSVYGGGAGCAGIGAHTTTGKRQGKMERQAIEVQGLRKTYAATRRQGPKDALKGLDLSIPAGSIFGLLGPNGAGKSTLINILAGLVRKTSGKVTIWGFDQDVNPRQSRAAIGVMPQELNMDPFFTPRAALEMQAGLYGVPARERWTDEILELVGLTEQAEAYARNLSGGMKRRLLLAKALVHRPQILVLDEPTAGVDIELRTMLWANVRRLNEEGMTIILTTHYLEEAEEMCDEIAIINRGELIVRDTTPNLLGRMDRKALVVEPETPPATEIALPEGVSMETRPGGRLAFSYSRAQTSPEALLDAIRASGITIRDVATEQPGLEEVFVALTSKA